MFLGKSGAPLGNAYIVPLDPRTDNDGKPYIPLYYYFPFGNSNSINPDSALVKPFTKLMEGGYPIGEVAFVFYREDNSYFVLGSFAFAHRIVFFPGLKFSRIIHTPDGRDLTNREIHNIKHFSLERDFSHWHIKAVQNKIKYPIQRTKKLNESIFLWFVMGIPDVSKLEPMPKTQEYMLKAPHTVDLERKKELMLKSVEGNNFPVTDINFKPTSHYFLNFEFFVSKYKTEELAFDGPVFNIPPPSSMLAKSEGGLRSKTVDDFAPNDSVSIYIRTSKISGSLAYDALCYSGRFYT